MARLKVLIPVDHAVAISGPHRNVVGTLNALGARDDVELVLLTGQVDPSEPYATAINIDVRLGFHPHDPKRILANLWNLQRAARGCDVVYVPSGLKAFLHAQTVRRGRRLVAGPNVSHLPLPWRKDSPGTIELRFLGDSWFEMSRSRRDHVRSMSGISDIPYIHHAIDLQKFSPAWRRPGIWAELGVPEEPVKVLFVGRDNEPRKGVSQLLDAMERLWRDSTSAVHLVIVGKMSDATCVRVERLKNVTYLGFRTGSELSSLYASADIGVVPSSWESFGFTVLEAMASGIPVISTRSGAIPEVIEDGQTGVLLELIDDRVVHKPDAAKQLEGAIRDLAADEARRRAMGEKGRQRAIDHFSEERLGGELMQLFRGQVLESSGDAEGST